MFCFIKNVVFVKKILIALVIVIVVVVVVVGVGVGVVVFVVGVVVVVVVVIGIVLGIGIGIVNILVELDENYPEHAEEVFTALAKLESENSADRFTEFIAKAGVQLES